MKKVKQMTVAEFDSAFPDEDACWHYLFDKRWPEGQVACPRCGSMSKVYELASKDWHWVCKNCAPDGYRFSLLVGTIFENTNLELRTWFRVIHAMLLAKKGVSALHVQRMIGGSYKTAWGMCHKIREAMGSEDVSKLGGIVEVDETYIGGKEKNKHYDKRNFPGGGTGGKMPVIGAVSRGGKIVAKAEDGLSAKLMCDFILDHVRKDVKLISTDQSRLYSRLEADQWPHDWVDHSRKKYVKGRVHTANIDSFWALVKRGVMGQFHYVSRKHLQKYVNEFQFRHNNRMSDDIFGAAVALC